MTEYCKVVYEGVLVEVSNDAIQDGLIRFQNLDSKSRKIIMRNVEKSIKQSLPKARKNKLTGIDRKNFCDDIGIWFTWQIFTGKAEKHKAAGSAIVA